MINNPFFKLGLGSMMDASSKFDPGGTGFNMDPNFGPDIKKSPTDQILLQPMYPVTDVKPPPTDNFIYFWPDSVLAFMSIQGIANSNVMNAACAKVWDWILKEKNGKGTAEDLAKSVLSEFYNPLAAYPGSNPYGTATSASLADMIKQAAEQKLPIDKAKGIGFPKGTYFELQVKAFSQLASFYNEIEAKLQEAEQNQAQIEAELQQAKAAEAQAIAEYQAQIEAKLQEAEQNQAQIEAEQKAKYQAYIEAELQKAKAAEAQAIAEQNEAKIALAKKDLAELEQVKAAEAQAEQNEAKIALAELKTKTSIISSMRPDMGMSSNMKIGLGLGALALVYLILRRK